MYACNSQKGVIIRVSHFLTTFVENFDIFIDAAFITLKLAFYSVTFALVIGLVIAMLKISRIKPLTWISDLYIWIIRGTPLVVQVFILYYGLTNFFLLSAFWSVSIGLAVHIGAYIAEVIRGTIQSIDKGQFEAGRSLGMNTFMTYRKIIIPQAFRRAIPPLANQFIITLKDSAIASFIGVEELFGVATAYGSNDFDFMTYYLISAVYYLVIVYIFTFIVNKLEKKLSAHD
ncbi:amino acid ABC transporter permease [Virgibacillus sp. W0181]|uniref:amino acid ABC transporter permease n=1 Tax=Virgibacillus sp. W0181 TaxID=3391581 RepID=UPI003F44CFB3